MNTHRFDGTGDAYDACQCDEDIKTGDTLVIEEPDWRGGFTGYDEDGFKVYANADNPIAITVVGLAWAWPLAVTVERGELHTIEDSLDAYERVIADAGITCDQIKVALDAATGINAPVRPLWSEYLKSKGKN